MAFDISQSITSSELLNFSQNFSVARPTVLDTLFPAVKTEYFEAEYYRLMDGQILPTTAYVHALDTEAAIGQRPGFEKVLQEKLFIKEKINQSERIKMLINKGVPDNDGLIRWVFDDMARLAEDVVTRTLVAKGQLLSTGKIKIKENNVDMEIDYGLPSENKISFGNWSNPEYDAFGDIEKAVKVLTDKGHVPNRLLTSLTQISYLRRNKAMQTAVLGATNARLLTKTELMALIFEEFGLEVQLCDEMYSYIKADGTRGTKRYLGEDKVCIYTAGANGSIGTGLWGPTPEEQEYRQFIQKSNSSFVTLTMWATPDPVATWTKASGMYIPVLPMPYSLVIGTVTEG